MRNEFIDVTITNQGVLDYITAGLSTIDKDEAVKSGLSKGGEVLKQGGLRRLKARMKSGPGGVTGNLLRSFTVRVKKKKPGVLTGFKRGKKGGNHSHLVDMGTGERKRKSNNRRLRWKGGSTGSANPNYFWSDTKDSDLNKAEREIGIGISAFVEKIKSRRV